MKKKLKDFPKFNSEDEEREFWATQPNGSFFLI